MPNIFHSTSRRLSSGTNTTRVHGDHDPTAVPGETTDGSGPLYPNTKQVEPKDTPGEDTAFGDKSPGVRRIEIIGQFFNGWHKWVLFFFIFLIACTSSTCPYSQNTTDRQMSMGTSHVQQHISYVLC